MALWQHSDLLALREVRRRYPHVISDSEWASIMAACGWLLGDADEIVTNAVWEEFDRDWTDPAWLAQEYAAYASGIRTMLVVEAMQRWQFPAHPVLLDYGAHTGGTGIFLLNLFGQGRLHSLEVKPHLAPAIRATAEQHCVRPEAVNVLTGDHRVLPTIPTYDLIYCGECLEHIADYPRQLDAFAAASHPGAVWVFTVPSGPWEMPSDRHFHVAHWEPADILSVFGTQDHLHVSTLQSYAPESIVTGWHVFSFRFNGSPFGRINFVDKLARWGFIEATPEPVFCLSCGCPLDNGADHARCRGGA
jgi:hypothetical protein